MRFESSARATLCRALRAGSAALLALALAGCATCGDRSRMLWSVNPGGPYTTPDEVWLQRQLASAVERHLDYPLEICRKGLSGEVVVVLELDAGGAIRSVALDRASGHPELDRILLEAWQRAQAKNERFVLPAPMRAAGGIRMRYGLKFAKP